MPPKHSTKSSSAPPKNKRVKTESLKTKSTIPPAAVQDAIFEVKYPIMNVFPGESRDNEKWRKQAEEHLSPFQGYNSHHKDLDHYFTVVPNDQWLSMRKYNNFIIQSDTYKNSETVFVKGKTESGTEPQDFWVARILQVRAKDPQHVYALVAWMYWPEELIATAKAKGEKSAFAGRRKYHGDLELIASNYMDVLDVLTFAGKMDIEHFSEKLVDGAIPEPTGFYWRQTFCRHTQKLSDLPIHCICNGHFNPSVNMYMCDNGACKKLFHSECLLEDALTKKYHEKNPQNGTDAASNGDKPKKKICKSKKKIYDKTFKGQFVHGDAKSAPMVKITDLRSTPHETTTQRVACPNCSTVIE